jgi:hypothetical protein
MRQQLGSSPGWPSPAGNPGQMHGFFTMVNVLPGQLEGIDYVVRQIDEVLSERKEPV